MNLTNRFKAFLISITKLLLQILSKFDPRLPQPTPPSDDAVDLEAPPQPAGLVVEHCKKDWTKTMVVFCLTSAIAIAIPLPLQVHSQHPTSPLLQDSADFVVFCRNMGIWPLPRCGMGK